MSLFFSDDRGMTEPYTDLPAIGLVSVGIILFGYLMTSAYFSYASSAWYAGEKNDLRAIAIAISSDPAVAAEGCGGVADARKLSCATALTEMTGQYGRPGSPLVVRIETADHTWCGGVPGHGRSASYRLPICVILNDATTVPGFLTATSWEGT